MKLLFRIFSLLLVLIFAIGGLAGCNNRGNEELIFVVNNSLEAAKDLNTHKGDKTAIIFLDAKAYRKLVTEYGFKNTPDYHNWIKYITAKYKLNKSNDKYVYTI